MWRGRVFFYNVIVIAQSWNLCIPETRLGGVSSLLAFISSKYLTLKASDKDGKIGGEYR